MWYMQSCIGRVATDLNRLLQEGQQRIQKTLVLMACKCLSMSCTMSEFFNVGSGYVLGEQHQCASDNPTTIQPQSQQRMA